MISTFIVSVSEYIWGFFGSKGKVLCLVLGAFLILACGTLLWQNQKLKNVLLEKENYILLLAKEAEEKALQAFIKNEQKNKEHTQNFEEQKKTWEQEAIETKKMWLNKKEEKDVVLWTKQEIPKDVQKLLQSAFLP